MATEAFTHEAAELTDAAVRMRAEAFTGAAGTSLTADITALERKPANDVADGAPLQGTKS
jgi:hypothetical protein